MSNHVEPFERLDPRFDQVIPPGATLALVADFGERPGAHWLESPVWDRDRHCLLFSDVKGNAIHRWRPEHGVDLFLEPSGFSGEEPFLGAEPGANGLAFDPEGRLLICEHGDRRLRRLEVTGTRTTLAERYQGLRFNSPNDLVSAANGDIFFTDPPFGLPRQFDDPARELSFSGVFRLSPLGELTLLTDELKAPNGIALAPDERTLYVADGNPERAAFLAFPVEADGTLGEAQVLLEVTGMGGFGGPDGLEVDAQGNLFAAGRERVFVIAPDGTHLGTIAMGGITTNVGWGEEGALFITTERRLYRLDTATGPAARHRDEDEPSHVIDASRPTSAKTQLRSSAEAGDST